MTAYNRILEGDCLEILRTLPDGSVDLVLTDPPYGVNYHDRTGRGIENDNGVEIVSAAFRDLYRVLKPNTFCVSFYGWSNVDLLFRSWRAAGFRPVGHLVWPKRYSSSSGFVEYRHEQAYLLAKGSPRRPEHQISDVQPWQYTGNHLHPTEKAVSVLRPLIEVFSKPNDVVLDPFSGSGSTSVAAAQCGRRYIGIEIEPRYCAIARGRLNGVACKMHRNFD